jgi:hypothetical protein
MKNVLMIVGWFVVLAISAIGRGEIAIPQMPDEETPSAHYNVFINDKQIPVWTAKCNKLQLGVLYSFAYFDMDGPVEVRVEAAEPFNEVVIRPQDYDIQPRTADTQIHFRLEQPRKISIEPYGMKNVLLLFANPPQTKIPDRSDKNVIFFGHGVHRVPGDVLQLKSGQTLYLAPGAVLKAAVFAADANDITITGRGIIDGSDWPWIKGPRGHLLGLERCSNVSIDGIILRGSYGWTLVPRECENVTVTNLKIVNDRVQNDDGINPCNSRRIAVSDCFIRTDDDCMSIKGLRGGRRLPSEDITIENMVFWCSRARIILFAHESQAEAMRRIRVVNSRIIHYTMTPFLMEPGEQMPLTDVVIDGIRINAVGKGEIARLRPTVNQYMVLQKPGRIENIQFKNLDITTDNPASVFFHLEGADPEHMVKQVSFENIRINGKSAGDVAAMLRIHPFVSGVSIDGTALPE